MISARRYPPIGSGEGLASFVHVDDAAEATVSALDRGGAGVYNVTDDDPVTARVWTGEVASLLGARGASFGLAVEVGGGYANAWRVAPSRAGYYPSFSDPATARWSPASGRPIASTSSTASSTRRSAPTSPRARSQSAAAGLSTAIAPRRSPPDDASHAVGGGTLHHRRTSSSA